MKINHVQITNWTPPGKKFWEDVAQSPDAPLIEASMSLTLSHNEYHEMLKKDRLSRGIDIHQLILK